MKIASHTVYVSVGGIKDHVRVALDAVVAPTKEGVHVEADSATDVRTYVGTDGRTDSRANCVTDV